VTDRELTALRESVRRLVNEWRATTNDQPRCDAWMRGFDLEFSRDLAARGWIGMCWPAELGGNGASNLARLVVTEELLRLGAPVAAHWMGDRQVGPAILRYGTPELQQEFLPRIASAEVVFCLGMSEPEAGSDLAAVRTRATRSKAGWRISGRKIWTSHAHRATHAYVLARTDPESERHKGLTEFIVDMRSSGVDVSPILDISGEHHFNEVTFDDVPVPERWVIGDIGDGWRQVTNQLAFERGGCERFLSTYPLFAQLLASLKDHQDDHLRADVGRLLARLNGLRALGQQLARDIDNGAAPVTGAAVLKYLGTSLEAEIVELARRFDLIADSPAGRLLRDAVLAVPAFGIRGGASDVLLSIIAKQVAGKVAP
jgi:acyl-CoA dehydrogenase